MHRGYVGIFQKWCFGVWLLARSQAIDRFVWLISAFGLGWLPITHFGSGAQAAGLLTRAHAHPEFQLWAPSLLIWVCASQASGERWGCLSRVRSPGAEEGGAPEAVAAAESSLTSH